MKKNILITGGSGYLGSMLLSLLSKNKELYNFGHIVSADFKPPIKKEENICYEYFDVRSMEHESIFTKYTINTVVHLASIVTPGKKSNRALEYAVDVDGTKNILKQCVKFKVNHIIVSSSGAAYGYHPENVNHLNENRPIRGNIEFAYSYHKRLVEEELNAYREKFPMLKQTVFRIGTILGKNVNNQITDLFKKPFLLGVSGSSSPFNFILDEDVAQCFLKAILEEKDGIYNLAGDGELTIDDFHFILKKPRILIPASVLKGALYVLKKLNLSQYGPEQVMFLQYRPVLDNTKLKVDFGFTPTKNSREVFEIFKQNSSL